EESIFHNIWFELTESNEGYAKNMVVLLKNSNHLLLDFKLTDEVGSFTFDNLEYGGYFLSIEKPGLASDEIFVEITADFPSSENNDFTIFDNSISPVQKSNYENYFDLYPNPTNDKIFVNTDQLNSIIIITNTLGTIIKSESLNYGLNQIDVSDFLPGLYIIEISSKNISIKEKLIVK
ncbi:MAG: T9SS type A sorting domain-containing protein, partial [Bacteroidales bacterium]|nr:T9SS type A sorting domain-containing protein [Bacteroidales bacterium]